MLQPYGNDLAFIHDAGFGQMARAGSACLIRHLRQAGLTSGRVVDLGCGSGISAERFAAAGYDVLGIDISADMIALARARVPRADFRVGSFLSAELPACIAVAAIGEVFSYLFDREHRSHPLMGLFRRIHRALPPGGLLLFDVVGPGRVPGPGPHKGHRQGEDWAVLVTSEIKDRVLTRHITSFRKQGNLFRRTAEVHRQQLYTRAEVNRQLRAAGFRARSLAGYGEQRFGRGQLGFMARKP